MRQHRFDENIHGALARAHVAGKADAVAMFARLDPSSASKSSGCTDTMRGSPSATLARGLQHRAPRAAAAIQPATMVPSGRMIALAPALAAVDRHRAHHGRQHKGLLGGLHLRDPDPSLRHERHGRLLRHRLRRGERSMVAGRMQSSRPAPIG